MGTLWQDIRYAARMLRQNRGFAAVAVTAIALGIGATTTIFSVVDTVLLRPLPYPEPDRLLWVAMNFPHLKMEILTGPDFLEWRDRNRVFENMTAYDNAGLTLTGAGDAMRIRCARVSRDFFATFRVHPALGREFLAEEDLPRGRKTIVLTDGFWRRKFGGDPRIVGKTLMLGGEPYSVVGVMPSSFRFPEQGAMDGLVPLQLDARSELQRQAMSVLHVAGRLKRGVTLEQARANLEILLADVRRRQPKFYRGDITPVAIPLQEHEVARVRLALLVLLASVGCVLLIACANVANLLLARSAGREREIALRAALGAGRWRLARQLLTESVLLGIAGGAAGIVVVAAAIRTPAHLAPVNIPRIGDVGIDLRVLGFALAMSLATGIVFGLAPALAAGRTDLNEALKAGGGRGTGDGSHAWLRHGLVVSELALSLVLLAGAGLLVESLWRLENAPLGFRAEHVLTVALPLRGTPYNKGPRLLELERTLTEQFRRLPGVTAVGITNALPPSETYTSGVFSREDRPPFDRRDRIYIRTVDSAYYVALSIPLLRGRLFTEREMGNDIPVAIVNETLARRYFPNENPLGKGIMGQFDHKWKKIVGVVADTKNDGLRGPIEAEMDQPQPDPLNEHRDAKFLIRTAGDPRASMDTVRGELREFDKNLPATIGTMEQQVDQEVAGPRFHTLLLSIFAAVALVLAAVGIYGVMSYSVARRTQEIGIRMALGAEPGDVLRLVMRQAALVTAAGVGLGLAGAFAATRYLASLLYGVTARDAGTFAGVALLLAAIALAASFVPARRATSVDPMTALRCE